MWIYAGEACTPLQIPPLIHLYLSHCRFTTLSSDQHGRHVLLLFTQNAPLLVICYNLSLKDFLYLKVVAVGEREICCTKLANWTARSLNLFAVCNFSVDMLIT